MYDNEAIDVVASGAKHSSAQPALSKLNTLRGVKEAIDTREGNLLSRTGAKTRPTFDIVADHVLGEDTSWKPSINLDEGETSLSQMKRTPDELIMYLFRECTFTKGVFLMTGTGIVPEKDFSLQHEDIVAISIDIIGTLINSVE